MKFYNLVILITIINLSVAEERPSAQLTIVSEMRSIQWINVSTSAIIKISPFVTPAEFLCFFNGNLIFGMPVFPHVRDAIEKCEQRKKEDKIISIMTNSY